MTTEGAVGVEFYLNFAPDDEPSVEGADEIETKVADGWLQKKYRLTAQNLVIKGKVTKLDCNGNKLTSLDVSRNTKLTELNCSKNSLTSLDVSKNTELTVLYCSNNSLASLDVRNNTKLKELFCYKNSLNGESLELPDLANEGILYFKYGAEDAQMLTEDEVKDIRDNKNWAVRMYVDYNWVEYEGEEERAIAMTTEKEVGGEIELRFALGDVPSVEGADERESKKGRDWLKKKYQLKAQNLVIKGKVTKLDCNGNKLTSLDVSRNTKLTVLYCSYNSLKSLDVSRNTELTKLDCSKNSLASLDVRNNTKLKELFCHKNSLNGESLELPALATKGILYFKYGAKDAQMLTEGEVKDIRDNKNWAVRMYVDKNWVEYKGERAIAMTTEEAVGGEIYLKFAPGDEPSVEGAEEKESEERNGWLKKKYQLKAQNLVIKGKVTKLGCSYNSLTSLDVRKNTKLTELYCDNNSLKSLDVSSNTKLTTLYCYKNKLTFGELKLPELSAKGNLYFKDTSDGDLQTLTKAEVEEIEKNWKVLQHKGGDWVDYPGE